MPNNLGSFLLRYGCATVSIALATWVRLLLDPALGTQFPFATVFFAILLTAWYGGFRPALVAVILGAISTNYFIMPPRGSFAIEDRDHQGERTTNSLSDKKLRQSPLNTIKTD